MRLSVHLVRANGAPSCSCPPRNVRELLGEEPARRGGENSSVVLELGRAHP